MIRWCMILWLVFTVPAVTHHDEPGSYQEYELRQERIELEINITELLHQLTYVPVPVRPRVYQELQDLQQRWNWVIEELIEIDRAEHPTQP